MKNHYYKHGMTGTKFYRKWNHIQSRCYRKKNKDFHHYGGRGIKCEWKNFLEFKEDMYESYLEHVKEFCEKNTEIDRINNDGNYCKENCRWATRQENMWNTRRNKEYTINKKTKTLPFLCREYNVSKQTVKSRLTSGWNIEEALSLKKHEINYKRTKRRFIIYKNKKVALADLAKQLKITPEALSYRLKKMTIKEAMGKKKVLYNGKFQPKLYLYKNKKYTIKELSKITNIKANTLNNRIERLKWSIKKAVESKLK